MLYRETRNEQHYIEYRRASNRVKTEVRKAVRDFKGQIAREAKANPKALKTCSAVADLERLDGTMAETDVDKAEVLNAIFTSVFTLESIDNIPTFENRLHNTELTDFLITKFEKILKTLKTTKPPGPGGLHPRLLVDLTDELVEPFQKIFTKSLAEGTLPQNWKEGNITPIYFTSVVCQMMEKLVRNEVMAHMTRNNLLSSLQHGFVHGCSCTTQLLEVLDKWTEAIE